MSWAAGRPPHDAEVIQGTPDRSGVPFSFAACLHTRRAWAMRYSINSARKSFTLVCVGPVTSRSSSAAK